MCVAQSGELRHNDRKGRRCNSCRTSPTVSKIADIRPVSKTVEPWFESRLAGHTSPILHTNIDGVIVQFTEVTKIVRF
jgi:hypothetical protein